MFAFRDCSLFTDHFRDRIWALKRKKNELKRKSQHRKEENNEICDRYSSHNDDDVVFFRYIS